MRRASLAGCLCLLGVGLAACGAAAPRPGAGAGGGGANPPPASVTGAAKPGHYSSQPYDPVSGPLKCMREAGLRAHRAGRDAIQIAPSGRNPRIVFSSTIGDAQAAQLHGQAEGAEVIGNSLVYVNAASDALAKKVESCVAGSGAF